MQPIEVSFFIELSRQENGVRIGYDKQKGLWFPHKSLEGGTDTIAYGHKLTENETKVGKFAKGITDIEAVELMLSDFKHAEDICERDWDTHQPVKWYTLERKYQLLMSELVFNAGPLAKGGTWRWPKLAFAVRNDDDQEAYAQSMRWFTDAHGVKHPLDKRVNAICRSLGLKFNPMIT